MLLKKLLLAYAILALGLSLKAQNLANNISLFHAYTFYPDIEYHANCTGLKYSHDIKNKFSLEANISSSYVNLVVQHDVTEDAANYGKVFYRNNFNGDLSLGYYLQNNPVGWFSIMPFVGASYLSGRDATLLDNYYSPQASYPVYEEVKNRDFGINTGVSISLYPVRNFGIGMFIKNRTYTQQQPDWSFGAHIQLRFSDLQCINGSTRELENHVTVIRSFVYFPDWKYHADGYTFQYSHDVVKNFFLEGSISYTYRDIVTQDGAAQDSTNYGKVVLRDFANVDIACGYYLYHDSKNKITLAAFAGPSYILGNEQILQYHSSYGESWYEYVKRNQIGINIGTSLLIYPIKNIGLGVYAKGRAYTKGQPDLNLGAMFQLRFSDLKIERKK